VTSSLFASGRGSRGVREAKTVPAAKWPSISCVRPATDECRFLNTSSRSSIEDPFLAESGDLSATPPLIALFQGQPRTPPPHVSGSSGSPRRLAPLRVHTIEANRAPPPPFQWLIWLPATTGTSPSAPNRGQPRTPPPMSAAHLAASNHARPADCTQPKPTAHPPPRPTSVSHLEARHQWHLVEGAQPRPTTHFLSSLWLIWLCARSPAALEHVGVAGSISGYGLECRVDIQRHVRCVERWTGPETPCPTSSSHQVHHVDLISALITDSLCRSLPVRSVTVSGKDPHLRSCDDVTTRSAPHHACNASLVATEMMRVCMSNAVLCSQARRCCNSFALCCCCATIAAARSVHSVHTNSLFTLCFCCTVPVPLSCPRPVH